MSTTASRPLRADALRNRIALLEAAEVAFHKRGTSASLEEIAHIAGVGIGTLYRHFPTREALIEALIRDRFEALIQRAEELIAEPDPFAAIEQWVTASVRHALAYRGLAESLVAADCGAGEGPLAASCSNQREVVARLLRRAQEAQAVLPEITVDDILDLGAAVAWVTERRGYGDPTKLVAIALKGLRA